jgi:hypothetical protein
MGAVECLYTLYGYGADVIAGTSVGSLTGWFRASRQRR